MRASRPAAALDLRGLPPRLAHLARPIKAAVRQACLTRDVTRYAVSITFVSDRQIARLNRRSLGRSGPTDVIAFDLSEAGLPYDLVGDIYISLDRARANGRAFGATFGEEVLRLAVHGMLHLVGHRDDTGARRRRMELVQERMVARVLGRRPGKAGSQ